MSHAPPSDSRLLEKKEVSFPVTEWCHAAQPPLVTLHVTCIANRVTSQFGNKSKKYKNIKIKGDQSSLFDPSKFKHNLSVTPKAARIVSSPRFSQKKKKPPLQLSYEWCKKNAFPSSLQGFFLSLMRTPLA